MTGPYEQSFNWVSRAAFVRAINDAKRQVWGSVDILTFEHIPHDAFLKLLKWADQSYQNDPRFRIFAYEADLERLVIRIPSPPHEEPIQGFTMSLLDLNGLHDLMSRTLKLLGAATVSTPDGRIVAEAGQSITPRSRLRHGGGRKFPSLVVEAGRSEHSRRLQQKARLWFRMSHATKIVLLIHVLKQPSRIIMEKWMRLEKQGPRARSRAADEAQCVQAVRVEPALGVDPGKPQTDPSDFNVLAQLDNPPLPVVLEFGLVCDRPPVPPAEADFHLDVRFFSGVWGDDLAFAAVRGGRSVLGCGGKWHAGQFGE